MAEVQSTVRYRLVKGFQNYRVGDDGSVWSQYSRGVGKKEEGTGIWRKLKPGKKTNNSGLLVNLCRNGTSNNMRQVHRLVLEAFVGPCPEGMECCHNDGDPFNNKLTNLRWDTHVGNMKDKECHGTHGKGERNAGAKLTEATVLRIRRILDKGKVSRPKVAAYFKVSYMTIVLIHRRKTWKHI